MPDALTVTGFVQNGLYYKSRDFLTEDTPYFEVRSDGTLKEGTARAGSGIPLVDWGTGLSTMANSGGGGAPLPPEVLGAAKNYLGDMYGFESVPDSDVAAWLTRAGIQDKATSKYEDFYANFLKDLATTEFGGDMAQAAARFEAFAGTGYKRIESQLGASKLYQQAMKAATDNNPNTVGFNETPAQLAARTGTGGANATGTGSGAGGNGMAGGGGVPGAAGSGGGGTPAIGPAGVKPTPEMLKDFIDSDFSIGIGQMVNAFKDAGAAGLFMEFLSKQAGAYIQQYKGELGSQAAGGQVPNLSFNDYLQRRTGAMIGTGDMSKSVTDKALGIKPPATTGTGAAGSTGTGTGTGAGAVGPLPAGSTALSPSAGETPGLVPNQYSAPVAPPASGDPTSDAFLETVLGPRR